MNLDACKYEDLEAQSPVDKGHEGSAQPIRALVLISCTLKGVVNPREAAAV